MTLRLAPPPLAVPDEFAQDKQKNAFFSALLNTIYQMWTALYGIRFSASVKTTDAAATEIMRVQVPTNQTVMLDVVIVARRTGGSSGTTGDSAFYQLTGAYKNISGALTGIGSPGKTGGEDQAAWDVAFSDSGGYALILVTGAANNNITWVGTVYSYTVGA
jgi:hypothetical protein